MKNILHSITLFAAIVAASCSFAFAQTSMQEQLEAVKQVNEYNAKQEKIEAAKEATRQEKQRLAKQAAINEKKAREQSYQDELRAMELEEKKLELMKKKAKANRVNEYIDQELKAQAAQTDVVQSNADAIRNVSSGTKEYLESTGRANEAAASKDTTVNIIK